MPSKKEIIDDALGEMICKIQTDMGKENPALMHADAELLRIGEQLFSDPLADEQTRMVLQKYVDKTISVTNQQLKHLYIQGMKDCVTFLRELGVIQ